MFVIFGAVLRVLMSYKPIYDARETAKAMPTWEVGFGEIMATVPVLGLYFMQTMVIAAIAVALATRKFDTTLGGFGAGRERARRLLWEFDRGCRPEFEYFQRPECDG